jgi:hypothetical protein
MAEARMPNEFYDLVSHHLPPEQPVGPKRPPARRIRSIVFRTPAWSSTTTIFDGLLGMQPRTVCFRSRRRRRRGRCYEYVDAAGGH